MTAFDALYVNSAASAISRTTQKGAAFDTPDGNVGRVDDQRLRQKHLRRNHYHGVASVRASHPFSKFPFRLDNFVPAFSLLQMTRMTQD